MSENFNMLPLKVVLLTVLLAVVRLNQSAAAAVKQELEADSPLVGSHSNFSIRQMSQLSWTPSSKQEIVSEGELELQYRVNNITQYLIDSLVF